MENLSYQEYLIERYFSRETTALEAKQLSEEWERSESFRELFRQHQEVELQLCFFAAESVKPLAVEIDGKTYAADLSSPGSAGAELPVEPDFDMILRIVAQDAPVPEQRIGTTGNFETTRENAFETMSGWVRNCRPAFRRIRKILPSRRVAVTAFIVLFLAVGVVAAVHEVVKFSRNTSRTVAHLSGFDHVVWGNCVAPILPGDPVENGWLRLVSGSVSLKLLNGSDIVLEGPADLRIDSDSNLFLKNGYLSADVPPQAKKLRIGTPRLKINVLGTAFWVKASEENSEVHLLRGKLELADSTLGKLLLGAGEAFSLPSSGKSKRFTVIKEDYVPAEKVAEKTEQTLRTWDVIDSGGSAEQEPIEGDSSLRVHFDFERIGRTVPNASPAGRRSIPSGKVVGCSRTEGYTPRSTGLVFRRTGDRIALDIPDTLHSATFSAWLRVDKPVESRLAVLMSSGMPPGGVQWMIGRGGVPILNIAGTETTPTLTAHAPSYFTGERLGAWVHWACVVDADAGTIVHYLDGKEAASQSLDFRPEICIGQAALGSWDNDSSRSGGALAIDEFMLFDRALGAEEIEKLYQPPAPQSSVGQ